MGGYRRRIATLGLAALTLAGCDQMTKGVHDAVRDEAAAGVDTAPADSIIGKLRQDFPQDYATLRAQVGDRVASGGSTAEVSTVSRRFVTHFYAVHHGDLEQAPAADLVRLAKANADLLAAIQAGEGDAACAAAWNGPPRSGEDPAPVRAALERVGQDRVVGIRDGLDHPAGRDAVTANPEDWGALNAVAAKSGVTRDQIADSDKLAPAAQCRVGEAVYGAIAALPAEQGARLMAFLIHTEAALHPTTR